MSPKPLPALALALHGVAEVASIRDPNGLFVSPSLLRRHIWRLREWGYEFVTFSELASRAARGVAEGSVALTFDDGFSNNATVLLPLLESERIPATVFVVSGWLGEVHPDAPYARILDVGELRKLHRGGVEVGGHTRGHPDLTTLPYASVLQEFTGSRAALEEILQAPVSVAAYPYGRATPETAEACRDAGYEAACRLQVGSWSDPFNLPRQSVLNGSTLLSLRLKRANVYERIVCSVPGRLGRRALRDWRRIRAYDR